jgi:hypothetical protein
VALPDKCIAMTVFYHFSTCCFRHYGPTRSVLVYKHLYSRHHRRRHRVNCLLLTLCETSRGSLHNMSVCTNRAVSPAYFAPQQKVLEELEVLTFSSRPISAKVKPNLAHFFDHRSTTGGSGNSLLSMGIPQILLWLAKRTAKKAVTKRQKKVAVKALRRSAKKALRDLQKSF